MSFFIPFLGAGGLLLNQYICPDLVLSSPTFTIPGQDKAKAHKDTTAKAAGGYMYTYTYFKITGVFKKVDFKKALTDKLYVKIEVGNCYEKDKIECDLKNLTKTERAICKA